MCNGNVSESNSTVTNVGETSDQSLSDDAVTSDDLSKMSNKLRFLYSYSRKFNVKRKHY